MSNFKSLVLSNLGADIETTMPLLRGLQRSAATTAGLLAFATAQTCYYPDGTESTSDTPCGSGSGTTSCCGANAWCLDNGLCFSRGVVSRGSCTDKTWNGEACAGYCKTVSANESIAITPCPASAGDNLFACGLSSTCETDTFTMSGGASFILRPAQAAALVQSSFNANSTTSSPLGTVTVTATANTTGLHTSGEMAGLGLGLAFPLLFAIAIAIFFYRRDRDRTPKLMYPLPDDCKDDHIYRRGNASQPSIQLQPPAYHRSPAGKDASDTQSLRTLHSTHTTQQPPTHMMSFMERYQAIKENLRIQERVELEAISHEPDRHELGDRRMSARSIQSVKTAKSMVSRGP